MKVVAVNGSYATEEPTGLGVYTAELIESLLARKKHFEFKVFSNPEKKEWMGRKGFHRVPGWASPHRGVSGHLARFFWAQTIFRTHVRHLGASLIYSPIPEGIIMSSIPQVVTIHDIIPVRFPELHPKMKYFYYLVLPLVLRSASAIVCVSDSTRKDLLARYRVREEKICVIHEGYNHQRFSQPTRGQLPEEFDENTSYFLFVGDMRPYKNLKRAIEAFSRMGNKQVKFVIAGRKDNRYYPEIAALVDRLLLNQRVVFLDYVPDECLTYLYSHALALVFVSLYEGFGLPVLEAMACGCPVIASNLTSIPEVAGEAAVYVDPLDTDAMSLAFDRVAQSESLRRTMREKGKLRAEEFSWARSAEKHEKLFLDVLHESL